jgi:hypothetical protein
MLEQRGDATGRLQKPSNVELTTRMTRAMRKQRRCHVGGHIAQGVRQRSGCIATRGCLMRRRQGRHAELPSGNTALRCCLAALRWADFY